MKIQNQQVNPLIRTLGRFLHERTPRPATRLIARRNNFRKGNNTIVAHMMHGNEILLAAVIRHVGFGGLRDSRLGRHQATIAVSRWSLHVIVTGINLRSQNIRAITSRSLLSQRIIVAGQKTRVE